MKKIILITFFLTSINLQLSATNIENSSFWEQDKKLHFLTVGAISGISSSIAKSYGSTKLESFFIGVATGMLIGIAKEYYDGKHQNEHTEDINDMYADTIGSITGSLIGMNFSIKF
jgi:uncharacterized protein YfiM (DUF2279 family)